LTSAFFSSATWQFEIGLRHFHLRQRLGERRLDVLAFDPGNHLVLFHVSAFQYPEPLETALRLRGNRGLALRHDVTRGIEQRVALRRVSGCHGHRFHRLRAGQPGGNAERRTDD
jgi:hypothetical protein